MQKREYQPTEIKPVIRAHTLEKVDDFQTECRTLPNWPIVTWYNTAVHEGSNEFKVHQFCLILFKMHHRLDQFKMNACEFAEFSNITVQPNSTASDTHFYTYKSVQALDQDTIHLIPLNHVGCRSLRVLTEKYCIKVLNVSLEAAVIFGVQQM